MGRSRTRCELAATAQNDGRGPVVDLKRTIVHVASHLVLNSLRTGEVFAAFFRDLAIYVSVRVQPIRPVGGRQC